MTSPFLDPGDVYYKHVQAMLLYYISYYSINLFKKRRYKIYKIK